MKKKARTSAPKRAARPAEIPTPAQQARAELLYRYVTTDPKAIGAELGLRKDTVDRMVRHGVWWMTRAQHLERQFSEAERSAVEDEAAVREAQARHRAQLRTALEITGYSLEAIGAALAKGEDIPAPVRFALRLLPGIDKLVVTDRLAHGLTTDKASDTDADDRYYAASRALAEAAERVRAEQARPEPAAGDVVQGDAGVGAAPRSTRIPPKT